MKATVQGGGGGGGKTSGGGVRNGANGCQTDAHAKRPVAARHPMENGISHI